MKRLLDPESVTGGAPIPTPSPVNAPAPDSTPNATASIPPGNIPNVETKPMEQAPVPVLVTPTHTGHHLFGHVLTILEDTPEYITAEIKDGINWIIARFEPGQARKVFSASEVAAPAIPAPAAVAMTADHANTPVPARRPADEEAKA